MVFEYSNSSLVGNFYWQTLAERGGAGVEPGSNLVRPLARPKSRVLVGSFTAHFFFPDCWADPRECRDFFGFTLPAARTAIYSLGTRISSHFQVADRPRIFATRS